MSFVSVFDPMNEKHVMWLKDVDEAMNQTTNGTKVNFQKVVNDNPMHVTEKNMMDWAFTHFQLCMKYTQSVLRGKAFIPKP